MLVQSDNRLILGTRAGMFRISESEAGLQLPLQRRTARQPRRRPFEYGRPRSPKTSTKVSEAPLMTCGLIRRSRAPS